MKFTQTMKESDLDFKGEIKLWISGINFLRKYDGRFKIFTKYIWFDVTDSMAKPEIKKV